MTTTAEAIPVLWVCGPPAVGKTSVAWEIYSQLLASGVEAGYVDIDQLGICYPEPASDPGRHLMKARNLGTVVSTYRTADARCVIVSGVVDPLRGVDRTTIPEADLTICRLRADPDELRQRLATRGAQAEPIDDVLQEARDLDTNIVTDAVIDTTHKSVAEVVEETKRQTNGWLVGARPAPALHQIDLETQMEHPPEAEVLMLCGAQGVGKSEVGFALYQTVLRSGQMAGYVDLDQLGFYPGVSIDHEIRARCLAGLWRTYSEAGARHLVVVGPIEDKAAFQTYGDAIPDTRIDLFRLHAGRDALTHRIMLRGDGVNWLQPGDPLKGKPVEHLHRVADQSAVASEALERAAIGHRIVTDERSANDVAQSILARSGWLHR